MRRQWRKALILFAVVLLLTVGTSWTVSAEESTVITTTGNNQVAGEDLFEVADRIIRDVYNHIAGISTVLAALMTAIAVITMKISTTQQKSDQAWDWLKRIWLAWAVINGIGAFIAYVAPLFDGYNVLP